MTVRDLLDLMPGSKDVCIKPGGRREYFSGIAEDAPESLMEMTVTEIQAKEGGELVIWIDSIKEWDAMVDAFEGISETPDIADNIFCNIMVDHERWMKDLENQIEIEKENRKFRYQINKRPEWEASKVRYIDDYRTRITPIRTYETSNEKNIDEALADFNRTLKSLE